MNTSPLCPSCGKPVGPDAPKGLCQECLLKAAFPTGTETGGPVRPFEPPAIAELAPKFPQLEINELVGSGGMGAVYRARQKELDRVVALKILPPGIGQDAAFAERFTREAKALARLNHPGIVTLYEFGRANGLFYFLMEFVDGVSLRRVLEAGRMSSREALAVVPQICDALQYAHDQGIVHRDIKPENILLDRRGRVKVADFGLAKLMGSAQSFAGTDATARVPDTLTGSGKVIGTPRYMAPEQAEHPAEVDHRADIYALGVVLYQMLTGELPGKPIEPPSKLVSVDVRLDEVVLRALEQNPERRYQQASVLKTEVETIVAGARAGGSADEWSVVPILETLSGTRLCSHGARKAVEASVVGLIVCLGAMALIGLNHTPWVGWCLVAGGLLALVIPIAIAFALEMRARKKGAGSPPGAQGQEEASSGKPGKRSPALENGRSSRTAAVAPWVTALRWTARLLGSLAIVTLIPFILAEGLPPIANQPSGVQLTFAGGFLLLLGFVVGFWRDGLAALLLAAGWTALRISEQGFPSAFDLVLVPTALYALCWWAQRGRRTPRLLVAAAVFAIVLALGRMLLPVNVFINGMVSDAVSGRAITNAEISLLPRPALPSWETNRPNARTGNNGRFQLYVGWYSPEKGVMISAPEYRVLTTSLGPRALGGRKVNRDFQLAPEHVSGSVVERVLYSVTSQRPIKGEDLDTGHEVIVPDDLEKRGENQFFGWLATNGVDLMAWAQKRSWSLWVSPQLASVESSQWDAPDSGRLTAALKGGVIGLVRAQADSKEGFAAYTLPTNTALPLSFAFETRERNQGVLQITSFDHSPPALKIRYRLVSNSRKEVGGQASRLPVSRESGMPGAGGTPALLLDQRGLTVTALSNELWAACVTFRNPGRTPSPTFPVLFYAGEPKKQGGRLISSNIAGPVGPGEAVSESTTPFLLRASETEIFAVIDPQNTLGREPAAAEWVLHAPAKGGLTVRQQVERAFENLERIKGMDNDRVYTLDVKGTKHTGGSDDFLRRRTGQEILASELSCGCGDYATAFIGLMEKPGFETLWVEGVEVSLASLKHRFSGHVVVAVRDPANDQWLLADPTARSLLSENWSRSDKMFAPNYWIGFVGPFTNYLVHSPDALREFYDRTLKGIPQEVLNRSISRLNFTVDASLQGPDGNYLNPNLDKFLLNYQSLQTEYRVQPHKQVAIRLVKGANDAISELTYSEEQGWVCTVGLKSACSLGFLSYLEREVVRRTIEGKITSAKAG